MYVMRQLNARNCLCCEQTASTEKKEEPSWTKRLLILIYYLDIQTERLRSPPPLPLLKLQADYNIKTALKFVVIAHNYFFSDWACRNLQEANF